MATIRSLAEEFGTDVDTFRSRSNVGSDVATEEQELTPLQEQNLRNTWQQQMGQTNPQQ